jgi:O-antigen ligase
MAVAADTIGHHPWLGVGLSKYGEGAALYDKTPEGVTFSFRFPVHNEFMLIAAELGLPALALFLSVLGMSLGQLFRIAHSRDDPLMPYLAAGIFCGWVAWSLHHQVEYNYALFLVRIWLFFGLAQAMAEILNTGQKRASV